MAMRGLPELSYGTPVARPQGVVTDPQAGSAWAAVADASEAVGALFKKRAVEEAGLEGEKVGRQLAKGEVARDESGKLQIQRPHLRDADAAFMLAAKTAYLSGTSLDIKTEVAKARAVHADDVEGFRAAVDGIAQSHLGNLEFPEWAGDIEEMIGREAGAHLNGIISAKMQRDMQRSASAVTAKLADNANDLYALSEQGQLQSEEGQRLLNETIEIFNSKVSNPAFNYSPEQADLEIREFRSELEARALVGEAERIFKTEGAESAAKWLDQQINDTSLELDPATRDKIETQGLKRINDLAQAQNAAATEARDLKYTEMNLRAEMGRLSVKQVNDALAKGEITPAAARSLHDKVIKDTTEDVGLTEALGRLASGMPMDPQNATDRKAANVAFDSLVKRGIDPLQATVNMAVTNGIIPDKPMSMIRGAGLSNDPRVVAGGYNAGVAVIENAPDAFDRMPGGDAMARDVEQYRHLTRDLGFSEQDAAGRIIQQRDPAFRRQAEAVLDVERPNISKLTSDDAMAAMGARGTG